MNKREGSVMIENTHAFDRSRVKANHCSHTVNNLQRVERRPSFTMFNAAVYLLFSPLQTNKASAQGDFQGASAASRQALWLSILSIVFGIITYICAIAALISYLSGKPP